MIKVNPAFEILTTDTEGFSESALTKSIERVGRRCYKSEDKITDTSSFGFAKRMVQSGHEAMVEHASLIFMLAPDVFEEFMHKDQQMQLSSDYKSYLRYTDETTPELGRSCIVSGNIRAWRSFLKACIFLSGRLPSYTYGFILKYKSLFPDFVALADEFTIDTTFKQLSVGDLKTVTEHLVHHDVTVLFTCDRGISHEIVRHRDGSFGQESTRYCNYANDKFGSNVSFIDIVGGVFKDKKTGALPARTINAIIEEWNQANLDSERHYINMIELGASPQIARSVLNNSTKTEIGVTFNLREWAHFCALRAFAVTGAPHPQMLEIAEPLAQELLTRYPFMYSGMQDPISDDMKAKLADSLQNKENA